MGKEILSYDDLLQIVELIKSAEAFSEFHLKIGDIELDLRKARPGTALAPAAVASALLPTPAESPAVATPAAGAPPRTPEPVAQGVAAPAVDIPVDAVVILSPMVGTFYRSPEPGARPFVDVGQTVGPETTVCIIEVMKLMNSLTAGCSGRVTHVLVNDAEPVDMGQALIVIDPAG